jgi:tRNA (guanine-N(7)-)-methyltransferase subunit TRM82
MPKRPSDLALTSDSTTLLVADKFGDVYSLPLIPSATPQVDAGNDVSSAVATPKSTQRVVQKGANALTVHSLRNVKALEDQRRQRESGQEHERKEAPTFEHELLLGHVSMLTSIAAASSGGKAYILTGDRDEHIRVSRGIPQAYVIENYCLGHTAFINALCLSHPDTLVSGGGDNELCVWDWLTGTLKATIDLLSHVQEVVSGADKLALSKLYSCDDGVVVAICERLVLDLQSASGH